MEESIKTSKFSGAIDQLIRLNRSWIKAAHFRENGKLMEWKWVLDSVEIELTADIERLKDGKKLDYTKKLENISKEIDDAEKDIDFRKIYLALKKREKLLRIILEESGKGSKLEMIDENFVD